MTETPRTSCEVCGRRLVLRADGTVRKHKRPELRGEDTNYCGGSDHRQLRWAVGQRLRHHAGSLWEIVEDRAASDYRDYLIGCVEGAKGEIAGTVCCVHGEYMHRDGWRPA